MEWPNASNMAKRSHWQRPHQYTDPHGISHVYGDLQSSSWGTKGRRRKVRRRRVCFYQTSNLRDNSSRCQYVKPTRSINVSSPPPSQFPANLTLHSSSSAHPTRFPPRPLPVLLIQSPPFCRNRSERDRHEGQSHYDV